MVGRVSVATALSSLLIVIVSANAVRIGEKDGQERWKGQARDNTRSAAPAARETPPAPTFTNSGHLPLLVENQGDCIVDPRSVKTTRYNSPRFPEYYYPGQKCNTWFQTSEPRYLIVTPVRLRLGAWDQLRMSSVYENTVSVDNDMEDLPIILPTSAFNINFCASWLFRGTNFAFKIEVQNTDCHQVIDLEEGATGELFIPYEYPANTICEWWIRAPVGKQVEVEFTRFFIGGSTCRRDYVIIDEQGDPRYLAASSRYCGGNIYSPGTVYSTDNAINILFSGQYGGYKGFNATYSVV